MPSSSEQTWRGIQVILWYSSQLLSWSGCIQPVTLIGSQCSLPILRGCLFEPRLSVQCLLQGSCSLEILHECHFQQDPRSLCPHGPTCSCLLLVLPQEPNLIVLLFEVFKIVQGTLAHWNNWKHLAEEGSWGCETRIQSGWSGVSSEEVIHLPCNIFH